MSCMVLVLACIGLLRKLRVMSAGRQVPSTDVDAARLSVSDGGGVFVPKWRALSYLRAAKRAVYDYDDGWDGGGGGGGGGERGLACECCVHMCTYHEMTEYCQQPPRRLSPVQQTDR